MNVSTLISDAERALLAKQLRADAVRYMRDPQNRDLFEPFIGAHDGNWKALDGAEDKDFGGYCERMSIGDQYGDDLTLKTLALAKNVNIQVFHFNSSVDEIRITLHAKTIVHGTQSAQQPDAAKVAATQGTVNIFHHVYQHGGAGHFNSIMQTEVKRSIDA